jgi:hypothetical protein
VNVTDDLRTPQTAPRARKRVYWPVPIVLSILAAVAAYLAVLEDAKAELYANRLEALVQQYLLNPPEEVFPNHEANRKRAQAERERQAFINRTLGEEEPQRSELADEYDAVIDLIRAREVEATKKHRETSKFIESLIERDVRTLEIQIPDASKQTLLTSDQTKGLFREAKLEEYLEKRGMFTLPIAGGVAGFLWGMAISWAATYPNLGWRRLSISLAALGILGAVCYPSDRASSLDRLGAAVGLAVVTPLALLVGREIVLWIVRGFTSKSAAPPAQ